MKEKLLYARDIALVVALCILFMGGAKNEWMAAVMILGFVVQASRFHPNPKDRKRWKR